MERLHGADGLLVQGVTNPKLTACLPCYLLPRVRTTFAPVDDFAERLAPGHASLQRGTPPSSLVLAPRETNLNISALLAGISSETLPAAGYVIGKTREAASIPGPALFLFFE